MATVAATNFQVHGFTTPNGFQKASDGKQVVGCFVSFRTLAGTYAAADDCTLTDVGAAIAASRRDGRTVTLLQACMAAPGKKADGTVIGAGPVSSVASDDIVLPLLQADLSTEHANGALNDELSEPITLFVLFKH